MGRLLERGVKLINHKKNCKCTVCRTKNELYRNKKWLYGEYIVKKLKMEDIAKPLNVHYTTIRHWLIRFNIPIRRKGTSRQNHIKLSKEAIQFITGELLGDGSIYHGKSKYGIVSARYEHTNKHKEYLIWLSNKLNDYGLEQAGKIAKITGKAPNGKTTTCYKYNSRSYVELKYLYIKWYPFGFKIVPRDIELSPIVMRQWYLGDGYIGRNRKSNNVLNTLGFCTCGFHTDDIIFLKEKLEDMGLKCTIKVDNSIIISVKKIWIVFNHMGFCPKEIENIYGYKFPSKSELKSLKIKYELDKFANETYRNRDWLYTQFIMRNTPSKEIGLFCGTWDSTIRKWLYRLQILKLNIQNPRKPIVYNPNVVLPSMIEPRMEKVW